VDTVPGFNADFSRGNGFVFHEYTPEALITAVKTACQAYISKTNWVKAMQRVSQIDFSWQSSASRYEMLYRQLLEKTGASL
jgi:starch synthase